MTAVEKIPHFCFNFTTKLILPKIKLLRPLESINEVYHFPARRYRPVSFPVWYACHSLQSLNFLIKTPGHFRPNRSPQSNCLAHSGLFWTIMHQQESKSLDFGRYCEDPAVFLWIAFSWRTRNLRKLTSFVLRFRLFVVLEEHDSIKIYYAAHGIPNRSLVHLLSIWTQLADSRSASPAKMPSCTEVGSGSFRWIAQRIDYRLAR